MLRSWCSYLVALEILDGLLVEKQIAQGGGTGAFALVYISALLAWPA